MSLQERIGVKQTWCSVVNPPIGRDGSHPRVSGLTMVIDKGVGTGQLRDLLDIGGEHIDYIKLGFGTSVTYPQDRLEEKIDMVRALHMAIYPGGTLFEVAAVQDRASSFFKQAKSIGFTHVEISEGSLTFGPDKRRAFILEALDTGLAVIAEVGKKSRDRQLSLEEMLIQMNEDMALGVELVIVEGRDSGRGVGVYDAGGEADEQMVDAIHAGVAHPERLMWEAPLAAQQQFLLKKFGPTVNLGNVQTDDVITLETTRIGLRGDTLMQAYALHDSGLS